MPIAQILLASGGSTTPTYTLTPFFSGGPESVNEGSGLNFLVGGTNIPDGTYYWTIGTGSEDFTTTNGTVSVTSNSGTFTVTPTSDTTTEGSETFIVSLRLGSTSGTILASSGSVTINDTSLTGPTPFSANFYGDDTIRGFQGGNGWWDYVQNASGAWLAPSTFSGSAPAWNTITYPDGVTTGHTYDFTAGQYLISPTLVRAGAWATTAISINFWFYPTANGVQLLTELGQPQLSAGYHTTLLEIDSSSYVKARFWAATQIITSSNTVNLNQWNHIYFAEDINGAHTFALNNVATTGLPTYIRARPTTAGADSIHYAIGGSDTTNMGNTSGFQGKIGILQIHDHVEASTYTDGQYSRFTPGPTYEWGSYDTSGNEGDTLTFNVDTTNVANGTTLYWNVVLISTISTGDFASTSGSFSINSNTGSFDIDTISDTLTEGGEPFTVQVRTVSNSGTVVLTSDNITIGDTSAGNRAPIAYLFNGTGSSTVLSNNVYSNITNNLWTSTDTIYILQGDYPQPQVGWQWRYDSIDTWRNILSVTDNGGGYWALQVDLGGSGPAGTTSQLSDNINADWALGTTWTIEFWVKPTVVPGRNGAPDTAQRILSQHTDLNVQNNYGYNNLDVCFTQGIIAFANQYAGFDAPAEMVGVWSHVAISSAAGNVKGFINGVQVYNYGGLNVNFTNGVADLYIGKNGTRTGANINSFDGRLTDIRISNTARYTSAFNPATALAPTMDGNTKLLLTPKQDSWYGSAARKLGYDNVVTVDYPTPPIYTVDYIFSNNVNEGSSKAFEVSGTNIPDGTYYWTVTNSSDFGTASGEFEIASNSGSFSVTPSEDATTEGAETFTVQIRSGSITGVILATSSTVTINDTSLTKVQLTSGTSLAFNGTDNRRVIVADNLADWDLGDNWTIEWWQKIPVGASGFLSVLCQDANVPTYSGIDVFVNAGNICMFNGNLTVSETPATRGEWNHIAIQKNGTTLAAYINGVSRTVSGSHSGTIAPSSPLNVVIGSRTADGGANFYGQYFNGQLANIRISTIARYSGTFTVPTTVTIDGSTVLALDGSTGAGGMLTDEAVYAGIGGALLPRHTITNVGAVILPSIAITNVSVGFNSRVATVDFTANVTQSETATIFFEWFSGAAYSGPHTLTVEPGSNIYTSPMLSLAGAGSDLTTEITIASGANACTSNIYTGSWSVICLVEGTMVTMADGSYKAIEDVRYNDLLRVWNFDLGEFSEALPVFVKQEETYDKHYQFTFSDGTVLRTVGHHVFNKQAGAFTMLVRDTTPVGTITFNELGEEVTLIAKETIEEPVRFYNVWTQYHLNLFAQGILTSNRFNNIYPIQDMKFVKDNRALRPLEEFANIDPKYISGLRLQEQPAQYTAEYIRDYVESKLERLDIANTVNHVHTE